ncbi:MAG: hypothetical protein GF390_03360 [Candidatus Pacebacteria bacterium]|nr:hypothetical protein [Candidatus Paceibacterota bacterium]
MLALPFWLVTICLFVLGAIIGSFLNVVIYRTVQEQSWIKGRSKCEFCQQKIAWYDNIPLLSFFFLKGKCRHCQQTIGFIHPVVEFLTGALFVWWYWGGFWFFRLTQHPFQTLQPLFWLLVGILLLIIFVADLRYLIIPDLAAGALLMITLLYRVSLTMMGVMQLRDLQLAVISSIIITIGFALLWLITKGKGFGLGDVKLVFPLGLLLGWPKILVGVFLAFFIGAITGIILISLKRKKFGQVIAFGPFLVLGTVLALIWGEVIWHGYLGFFK